MDDSPRQAAQLGVDDVQREFPDWNVVMDRDFTGRCFAYQQSSRVTLSGQDPAALRDKIRACLARPD
jgi:hypothetical protein